MSRSVGSDTEPAVEVRDLVFRWSDRASPVLALDHLRVECGEHLFIEGPSGSGKSTLLSLLAGVVVARQGSVRVLGRRLEDTKATGRDHFRADHVGYIFQMFNLIPYLSVLENVLLPCRFSRARRERASARSGTPVAEAWRLLNRLGLGEAARLNQPATALSVGQQQRVAAARALMGAPELLIADEPTSSLDADRRADFVRLVFQECAASGATLILVSHDAALEPLFDRTIRLAALNRALGDGRRSSPMSAGVS